MLFRTLTRRCHALMKRLAQQPDPIDIEAAAPLLQALEQLAEEAERLEAQLRVLTENRQPVSPARLRMVSSKRCTHEREADHLT